MPNHPASAGSNIHLIGGISCEGVVLMDIRRGTFKSQNIINGSRNNLLSGKNRAPSHSSFEVVAELSNVPLLKLGLYTQ